MDWLASYRKTTSRAKPGPRYFRPQIEQLGERTGATPLIVAGGLAAGAGLATWAGEALVRTWQADDVNYHALATHTHTGFQRSEHPPRTV